MRRKLLQEPPPQWYAWAMRLPVDEPPRCYLWAYLPDAVWVVSSHQTPQGRSVCVQWRFQPKRGWTIEGRCGRDDAAWPVPACLVPEEVLDAIAGSKYEHCDPESNLGRDYE